MFSTRVPGGDGREDASFTQRSIRLFAILRGTDKKETVETPDEDTRPSTDEENIWISPIDFFSRTMEDR